MGIGKPRPRRTSKEPLWKSLYLTDSQYVDRLISHPDNRPTIDHLDLLYERLKEMRPEIVSSFNAYILAFAAVLLSRFHLLSSIETPGLKIAADAVQYVLLLGWAYLQFKLSYLYAKHGYVAAIFDRVADKASPTKRSLLIAKYPFAFFILRYYPAVIGNLPHVFKPGYPIKAILAAVSTVLGLVLYFALSTWLFISVVAMLWETPTAIPQVASKGIILAAIAFAAASWLLPSNWLLKRRYTHGGLVTLMSRLHENNRPRWSHFVRKIDAAQRSLGIKA
jgi:hypothetical protein